VRRYKGVRLIESKEPIGKVSAINVALAEVATPYCLIMDDDVLIGGATFPTDPLGEIYGGIAFRVLPKKTNWVTLIQAHEYRKSMDIGKVFHNARATVQNISGAIGLFKTGELKRQIEIHTGEFCGEDLQRTLLIHLAADNRGVVIVDSLVETEVPDTLPSLFKQRVYGWNPGMYSNFLNYLRLLTRKNIPWTLKYDAFYNAVLVTLADPLRVVALPVLIFNPAIALVIYATYVFLESIPYLALKRKEPYWVVPVFPLYGIFNFVGRITAFAVFAYRRFAVMFARQDKPDDYRHAPLMHKFSGVIASQMLSLLLMLGMLASYFTNGAGRLSLHIYTQVVKLAF
jgi:cellulose synthase/poly-beta-1,6-N-acetylglucosamine synthase-like glycosyltransferase